MRKAIDWHLAEIERLRGIKIKSRQIRRRILFHEISAKELEAIGTCTAAPVGELETVAWENYDDKRNPNDKLVYDLPFPRNGDKRLVYQEQAEAIVAAKNSEISALENLRPHWAKGYSSDSVAAQTVTAALSQLWVILGVANQTEAVQHCTALKAKLEASEKARDDAITHRLKANNDWRVAYEALEKQIAEMTSPVADDEVAEALKGLLNPVRHTRHPVAHRVIRKLYTRNKSLEAKFATATKEQEAFNELCKLTFVIQHSPNCPDKFLIRLPGKSCFIDMKPYRDQLGMRSHETGDVLGYGKTLQEAFDKARAALEIKE